jgi:hypothetical protein
LKKPKNAAIYKLVDKKTGDFFTGVGVYCPEQPDVGFDPWYFFPTNIKYPLGRWKVEFVEYLSCQERHFQLAWLHSCRKGHLAKDRPKRVGIRKWKLSWLASCKPKAKAARTVRCATEKVAKAAYDQLAYDIHGPLAWFHAGKPPKSRKNIKIRLTKNGIYLWFLPNGSIEARLPENKRLRYLLRTSNREMIDTLVQMGVDKVRRIFRRKGSIGVRQHLFRKLRVKSTKSTTYKSHTEQV